MQTNDADNLFVTHASRELSEARAKRAERFAEVGRPLSLSSKPLAIKLAARPNASSTNELDEDEHEVWVAESGFVVRRIGLTSGKTRQLFKGHTGPVTALDLVHGPKGVSHLVTGSWDKSIRVWDASDKQLVSLTPNAHTDFVKAVHVLPAPFSNVVASASSDKDVRLWDLGAVLASSGATDATPALKTLARLRGHVRTVNCLASMLVKNAEGAIEVLLLSADSLGEVRGWRVRRDGDAVKADEAWSTRPHQMAVHDMLIEENEEEVRLWTAGADNSILCSKLSRLSAPAPLLRIPSTCVVRSLALVDSAHLACGAADDQIALIDLDAIESTRGERFNACLFGKDAVQWSGEPAAAMRATDAEGDAASSKIVRRVPGHAHEVTGLLVARDSLERPRVLVSASLDGTLRRWDWPIKLEEIFATVGDDEPTEQQKESLLTAEEEAELAELLSDED